MYMTNINFLADHDKEILKEETEVTEGSHFMRWVMQITWRTSGIYNIIY